MYQETIKERTLELFPPPSFFNFAQTIVKGGGGGGGVGRLWWPMCAIGKSCRARVNQYFFCKNFYFIDQLSFLISNIYFFVFYFYFNPSIRHIGSSTWELKCIMVYGTSKPQALFFIIIFFLNIFFLLRHSQAILILFHYFHFLLWHSQAILIYFIIFIFYYGTHRPYSFISFF